MFQRSVTPEVTELRAELWAHRAAPGDPETGGGDVRALLEPFFWFPKQGDAFIKIFVLYVSAAHPACLHSTMRAAETRPAVPC